MKTVINVLTVLTFGLFASSCSMASVVEAQPERPHLKSLLGYFPTPPPLKVETLETVKLEQGYRHKIKFLSEPADPVFDTPPDYISAYLLVPFHEDGEKLPAIVAIHQDGPQTNIGKLETAGIKGDPQLFYGTELFERGYIVICPDRFYHAERRRIKDKEERDPIKEFAEWIVENQDQKKFQVDEIVGMFHTKQRANQQELLAWQHWCGQLLLNGRTAAGKEAYDLMRSVDVLASLDMVDKSKIGTIGHSAGGYVLVYFMFADERVKLGVSSCGFFEVIDFYNENVYMKRSAGSVIPNLAAHGRKSADYLACIAPRPFLMTRGQYEWGDGEMLKYSEEHVAQTTEIEGYARKKYANMNASDNFKAIYFTEGGGNHAFPTEVKEQVYSWVDSHLKGD